MRILPGPDFDVIERDGSLQLPEEVLREIRLHGVFDQIAIDPCDGRVLSRICFRGGYDSYSQTYVLNGRVWKLEARTNLSSGQTICHLIAQAEPG